MIDGLKPYPEYKDSGVAWLGDVPEHWEVQRIKTLFREKDERSGGNDAVLLSLTRAQGIVPQAEASSRIASTEDLSKYKVCRPGDLVMNRMQAWSGMFALSTCRGVVSPDYSLFAAVADAEVKFFEHLLKAPVFVDQFAQRSKGIGSGFNRLYTPEFGAVPAVVPPLPEQAAIVRFLDYANRRIRRYIRAKQKLIKLLEEQKQAIIHRAVTRGLDPNVRLKPSGLEWLGDVPEHWAITRLKFVASAIVDCLHATPQYAGDGEFPAIRTADICPGVIRLDSARRIGAAEYARWIQRMEPTKGDIVYSREGERFGIAACVPPGVQLCISQRMMVFRIRPEHNPTFVMWLLNSPQVYAQATQDVMGATAPHVNVWTIRNYALALPTRAGQQDEIVEAIERAINGIDPAIVVARREVSLLREYRTRLIADVVTGKLDVREAAARLPDEVEESEQPDEVESETDMEEAAAEDLEGAPEEAEA